MAYAEKHISKAVELKKKEPLLHVLYAKILLKRGRIKDAEKQIGRALLLEPDHPDVRKVLLDIRETKNKNNAPAKKGLFGKIFGS